MPGEQIKEKSVERKSEGEQTGQRKKRRYRPGMVPLPEIRTFQKSSLSLIRKLPFVRWVRKMTQEIQGDLRF